MGSSRRGLRTWGRSAATTAAFVVAAIGVTGCMHVMQMVRGTGAERPAAEAFGLGPRTSDTGIYSARLEPESPLRTRTLQSVRVVLTDAAGAPVEGAAITVDGGMPQHGHGLPTQPRVTQSFGGGAYRIDGVRFNMGGWWELKLTVATAAGVDRVTFNLDL